MKSNVEVFGMLAALLLLFAFVGAWKLASYNDCRSAGMSSMTCFMMVRR